LVEAEFAEFGAKLLHLGERWVILSYEAFFEIEELNLWSGRMIEDLDEQVAEVHFDAGLQFGERFAVEVVVVLKGDFAGVFVDFDDVGLRRVAVAMSGAVDEDAEDGRQFGEEAAVDH